MHFDGTPERNSLKHGDRSQRGAGKLKAVVFAALALVAIYMAFKLVPPYISEYQLQDKMQEQARYGIVNRYTDEQVRDNVFKAVQDLDIQGVKREDIKVSVSQSAVKISMDYTVPVDLLFYSTELHFSPSSENKALF
ncbi:MAG TPA: DUF4845 domain-containing protein [Candidatus Acidoferrum sp.]|nr:DUF4845 domain-containing protein [Candidatus Acidoferrum sp.]